MIYALKRLTANFGGVACLFVFVSQALAGVSVGDRPNIDFTATDGTRVTSEALRGRIVIIDFWATWCGPCVQSMPHMIKLNQEYASQGVQVLGVSLDSNRRSMESFIKQRNMPWPQYFDGKGWNNTMAKAWGVKGIPRIFILSPEGEVLWAGHPANMDSAFQDALKNHPPSPPQEADNSPSMNELRDQVVTSLRRARAMLDKADGEQLLTLIGEVPEELLTDKRVLANARVLFAMLELKGETVEAIEAAKAANPEAAERFAALAEAVENEGPVAADPQRAAVHPRLVESKLAQAQQMEEAGKYYQAYTLYDWLLDRVPETEAGHTAALRIAALESDEQKMLEIRVAQAESEAKALLSLAQNYEAAGNPIRREQLTREY